MEIRFRGLSARPAIRAAGAWLLVLTAAQAAATPHAAAVPPPERPRGVVSLDDALAAALRWHPALGAAALEIEARDAAVVQASFYPNPELSAVIEDFAGSSDRAQFEQTETTISLAQRFEIGGKRGRRRSLAESERQLATRENALVRADIAFAAIAAFYGVVAGQERLALVDDLLSLNREAVRAAEAQVAAGAAPPFDATRARLTTTRAEGLRLQLERNLAAARARLAAAWGETSVTFEAAQGPLPPATAPPALEEVDERLAVAPALAARGAEIDRRQAALELQRARRIPDVTLRFGGRHFNDDDTNALVAEVSVPLQIFDRNQGAVREAAERLAQARLDADSVRADVYADATGTYQQMRAAFERWQLLHQSLVPDARRAHEEATAAYRRGAVRQLDVLDAQRTLFDLRSEEIDVLLANHLARADLDRLTGTWAAAPSEGDAR